MEHPNSIFFESTEIEEMAIFISNIVKQGIQFKSRSYDGGWMIEFTGGF